MNLGIMGAGYVGLTTAICLASIGHKTVIYDISQEKIGSLKNNNIPFQENGLDEIFENAEQIAVSRFYERLPKPWAIAIQELLEDKIYMRENEEDESKCQRCSKARKYY